MERSNIVLIGMPSSGKTSVGKPLSEVLNKEFVDTDVVIKEKVGKPLRDIVKEDGLEAFLRIQEQELLRLNVENHVISTGGGVIYNESGMNHLKENGKIVYLKTSLEELEKRITPERRLARNNGQSFSELYSERCILYEKYADIIIDCDGKEVEAVVDEIMRIYKD